MVSPGKYRHFKGNEYQVLHIARDSETDDKWVVYRPLYGEGDVWVRPLSMFEEWVDRDGLRQPRFQRCSEEGVS
jgi:hypothetical protein